jgi:hypothetical protein
MNTKRILVSLFAFALALAFTAPAPAQTAVSTTTLSQAISAPDPSTSTLGLVGGSSNSLNTIVFLAACNQTDMSNFNRVSAPVKLLIDAEAMDVQAVLNSTTCAIQVLRGTDGTAAVPHASAAIVYVGTPDKFGTTFVPAGTACTAGQGAWTYSPRIVLSGATFANIGPLVEDCINGRVVTNTANLPGAADPQINYAQPFGGFQTPYSPTGVTLTAVTDVATTVWFDQIFIPVNAKLTGACVMNGSGAGTDSVILFLWDQTGALVANTALAGTASAGATQYQCIAFTATVNVQGPQSYFVGVQGNGTTAASFQAYPAGSTPKNYGATSKTGVTFGTQPSITPTTTFTAGKGVLMAVY